jgi:Prophage antirepressor
MNNTLQQFTNEEFGSIRAIQIDGEPWFVGKDIADALGYGNYRQALKSNVDADDKGVHSMDTLGGKQNLTIINESGLYSLILSSRLPAARKFKRWVTSEVLPSIRKHGVYATDDIVQNVMNDPDLAYKLFCRLQTERGKTAALEAHVEKLAPKARYCDLILQCKNALPISLIAKDYDMSAISFNRMLHDFGIQHKIRGTWLLYQKYSGQGYTVSNTFYTPGGAAIMHTCWTQKGRLFLYNALAYYGILPSMEKQDAVYY